MEHNIGDGDQIPIFQTRLVPADQRDSQSVWGRFIDGIRRSIGLKPIHLAERWATAKVRQEEAQVEINLLNAKANYELTMAKVRILDRTGEAAINSFKNLSVAENSEILIPGIKKLLEAKSSSPEACLAELEDIIKRITTEGGSVEMSDGIK